MPPIRMAAVASRWWCCSWTSGVCARNCLRSRAASPPMATTASCRIFSIAKGKFATNAAMPRARWCRSTLCRWRCRRKCAATRPKSSGRAAFYAAQEFPERFRANASLHGTWLVTDAADSPHTLAHRMRGEFYCGYGARDRFATPDVVAALEHVLAGRADLAYRFNLHAGAGHGYALPD